FISISGSQISAFRSICATPLKPTRSSRTPIRSETDVSIRATSLASASTSTKRLPRNTPTSVRIFPSIASKTGLCTIGDGVGDVTAPGIDQMSSLASPPKFEVAERVGNRITLKSEDGHIVHLFVPEEDIVRVMILPSGRIRFPRTWAVAPGQQDV